MLGANPELPRRRPSRLGRQAVGVPVAAGYARLFLVTALRQHAHPD
ncbi:MAG: hypothetical protein M3Y48_12785 [Actinomycetota bacterium]|nr:hypothetical protein [Actinomycetota bacterium]